MPVLRNYQYDCVESVFREWEKVQATMAVLPTGSGKSVIFSEIVRRMHPKRSIVMAHRDELIHQAVGHIKRAGLTTEIEKACYKSVASSFGNESTIVASVQTLISGNQAKRMEKFKPHDFGCLVIDEGHHCAAKSYRDVIDYFKTNKDLKIFSCTATPDRADEKALGQIFESVAFKYEILDAIEDGWLVPIDQQMVKVGTMDFSHVKTTAGDLNGAELARVMEAEKNLHALTGATIEIIGNRKTIVFTASVAHAEKCSDIFNRHRQGMSDWVCGKTHELRRKEIISDFAKGKTQILVNVGVATEGFDVPDVEVVVNGRPTKSRALYCQIAGRATRPLPGILDDLNSSYERREAISSSSKPSALILDFVGNSGRHKLITTADILGGKYDEETRKLAEEKVEKSNSSMRMSEALKESQREIQKRIEAAKLEEEARKARLVAKVQFTTRKVDPFDAYGITPHKERARDVGKQFTEKQRGMLVRLGVDPDQISYSQGRQLMNETFRRWNEHLATAKQISLLKRFGVDAREMKMDDATAMITQIKNNGWRKVAA